MLFDNTVPLPARGLQPTASLDAFVSLCELTNILDDLSAASSSSIDDHMGQLASMGRGLDAWKATVDNRGLFMNTASPGIQSLHLAYLGARLMVIRATWDSIGSGVTDRLLQIACQEGCLCTCEEIVAFVCSLSEADLAGYWSSRE